MCALMSMCVRMRACVPVYVLIFPINDAVHTHMCICMCEHKWVCVCSYFHNRCCVHTHMCICMCEHKCVQVRVCVCVCVCVQSQ